MKLHLGCGKRYIPGFVHVDIRSYPHVDHVQAIDSLEQIPSESCSLIYACHVIEHFKRYEIEKVLIEWCRVLKRGATIRLSVPDLRALSMIYLETGNLDLVVGPLCGRQDHQYNIHYNVFDYPTLSRLLERCGFTAVRPYDWRKTEHSNIDDFSQAYIPHMDKDNGHLISLNVEASKK
jgi:predicted SAM-dependent methyltransferase